MTTTTPTKPRRSDAATPRTTGTGVTPRRVLAAEWIKMRSSRAGTWLLLAGVLSIPAAGLLPALATVLADPPPGGEGAADPTGGVLSGIGFTQLLIAALGVLLVSSEYASGLIRTTLTAVPRRLPVLWAKAVLAGVVTFVVTLAAVLATFFGAQAILTTADVSLSLTAPGVLRAVVGSALLLAVTAVLGVGFGWVVRSTAGAAAGVFGVLFVLPLVGLLLPAVTPYLPSNAGSAILRIGSAGESLPPWVGLGLFTAYAAVTLAAAAVLLERRDA